jgi:hypothetical protein
MNTYTESSFQILNLYTDLDSLIHFYKIFETEEA